jgi:small subunit ribosomal protein S6
VQELERQLKINEDVLRYITVKVDQFEQSSSNKARRDRATARRSRKASGNRDGGRGGDRYEPGRGERRS